MEGGTTCPHAIRRFRRSPVLIDLSVREPMENREWDRLKLRNLLLRQPGEEFYKDSVRRSRVDDRELESEPGCSLDLERCCRQYTDR